MSSTDQIDGTSSVALSGVSHWMQRPGSKPVQLFQNFSLTVPAGGIHAILGESGCGKSTLLRLLIGEHRPSAGEILVGDKGPRQFCRNGSMGYAEQEPTILPWRTVRENIALPAVLKGTEPDRKLIDELLQCTGLHPIQHQNAVRLSGGEKKRLAFARAFSDQPSLVLLDEPFSGVDLAGRLKMYDWLHKIFHTNNLHQTVVLVTHSIEEASLLARSATVIAKRDESAAAAAPSIAVLDFPENPLPISALETGSPDRRGYIESFERLYSACHTAWCKPDAAMAGN